MKLIILVAVALAAVAVAAPPEPPKILRSEFDVQPQSYVFGFETENGIARSENGEVKEILDEEKKLHVVVVQRGSFSYTDPDGNPQVISYEADENGYRAVGDSIPKVSARR